MVKVTNHLDVLRWQSPSFEDFNDGVMADRIEGLPDVEAEAIEALAGLLPRLHECLENDDVR